ncbi:aminomethyl-transferring glycine dehydrogenase [Paraburkholderia sp. BL10I2N1]|uniref:aminomethyl-transferring glycine dehydrogenase n=1 Tax=Paraburkholderia sp. BL10I2N1 TaxID=1938796 RepID=UPI00105FF432|nr:aminomethyl-transferring glycine dehydrogenase [Paraburkholderia sp. BL10I2N1]TDN58698.1 glycine dehydrogenase (decarboxylating) alpha subunit /glycine dehydrogenase (decarboxylating) beta subunit [Paraburkholderia sp. BL10I2N1]
MSDVGTPLAQLQNHAEFVGRHIGPTTGEQAQMLAQIGFDSIDEFIASVVPPHIAEHAPLALPDARTEVDALKALKALAAKNRRFRSHIGTGYYDTHTPNVILRNLLENPAWYTAYTPYQPEISQGRLEALLNFQTMITDLTRMEIANASLLDEATACAEAMTFCQRLSKSGSNTFVVSTDCHPQTIDVIRTRAEPLGIEVVVGDAAQLCRNSKYFGVLLQYPATQGDILDYAGCIANAHERGALAVVSADLLALTLLKPPGEFGADVVVGTAQRFGVPLGFGGPHAAFFATKEAFKRDMPGRLVGVSVDRSGKPALRLAMQTREQHIRREKATSNICTAQVLLAIIAGMYAAYHGPAGLVRIAERVHRLTAVFAAGVGKFGFTVQQQTFFDTVTIVTGAHTPAIHAAARQHAINLRVIDDASIGVAFDETTTAQDVETLWSVFAMTGTPPGFDAVEPYVFRAIPKALLRSSPFLEHPTFNRYHSETEMMRYLRRLSDKDLALDRTMIPLGSCTMKLNAAAEMIPVTWPEFGGLHPFAPEDQTEGYRVMIEQLEQMLCVITGYDAVSLQPNAGSQGEYAGLLAIRGYHASRGEGHRNVCLIPSSAHGTNPATAQMAGMEVVVVACDRNGNVDVADLRQKAEAHSAQIAALMITYPSTHGVFEEAIRDLCDVVHRHGGQVYIDGANMNAMVGLCKPGQFGGDVSHLNLHKTFCIPHGGGGPGVGPIGVKTHLAPFLPGHSALPSRRAGAVAAAPWGSASILPITWMYITMMGAAGLRQASQVAMLNANYIANRLAPHYPILYAGKHGFVAHECIVDMRPLKEKSGITVDDLAKRLIDYGFHAPTMSFPVAGTLMIEPTESESKQELDRFCDAMIAIREEIRAVELGQGDVRNNPLTNAPHTAQDLAAEWVRPYSREQAVFPLASSVESKYWPPVGRVDNVYGDRNLVCSCPPLSDYAEPHPDEVETARAA